jgi:hypothetical protein
MAMHNPTENIIERAERGASFNVNFLVEQVETNFSDSSTRLKIIVSDGVSKYVAKDYWADNDEAQGDMREIRDEMKSEFDRAKIRYSLLPNGGFSVNPKGPRKEIDEATVRSWSFPDAWVADLLGISVSSIVKLYERDGRYCNDLTFSQMAELGRLHNVPKEEVISAIEDQYKIAVVIARKPADSSKPSKSEKDLGGLVQGTLFDTPPQDVSETNHLKPNGSKKYRQKKAR